MSVLTPRVRILYLLGLAVGIFALSSGRLVAAIAAAQVVLWFASGLSARQLTLQLRKLAFFGLLILGSYALVSSDPAPENWLAIGIEPVALSLHIPGLQAGAVMLLRIIAIVLASRAVRSGDEEAIAQGLSGLGLPPLASASVDTVLALVAGSGGPGSGGGGGSGRGGGGRGGGRKSAADQSASEGFLAAVRELASGNADIVARRIDQQIKRASQHAARSQSAALEPSAVRDVGVIAGLSLTMLGVRALQILPAVPFAPGHKLVILTPLYVAAAKLSSSRAGSTLTGFSMGSVSFLMGAGRYGIFEVAKHVAPGVVCDLGLPLMLRGGRRPSALAWALFGGAIALGRYATIFGITLLTQPPALAYAFLLPGLAVHLTFGLLSGYVTGPLMRGIDKLDA